MTLDLHNISNALPDDFGPNPLPKWVRADDRWYEQLKIVEQAYEMFMDVGVVFLQAPTGTGKTLIGELLGRLLGGQYLYTCSTKQLQDQFAHDFDYAKVIKGRSNYLTQSGMLDEWGKIKRYGVSAITCADCTGTPSHDCAWCVSRMSCPYYNAKTKAEVAQLACLNYSFFLTDANYVGKFTGRRFMVADECDLLEEQLLRQFEINISGQMQAYMGLYPPAKKTVESAWIRWLDEVAIPTVTNYLEHLPTPEQSVKPKDIKIFNRVTELRAKLVMLGEELGNGGWVYEGYSTRNPSPNDPIIFRPVRVNKWGKTLLWPHAEKFLLMSATILSADVMADELGLEKEWGMIDVGSSFPVANRPIYVVPVADMSYKNREQGWKDVVKGIEGVAKMHKGDERILVHCVSYALARYIKANLHIPGRLLIDYESSAGKGEALKQYKKYPGSVLMAASMDRGIDLPDDLCRVQIVAKIPFPNIKDKRVIARMYGDGGINWYRIQTIRTLIQMTGRGVRSKDDWCVTYILDRQFGDSLWKSSWLFPAWWTEALNWTMNRARLGI